MRSVLNEKPYSLSCEGDKMIHPKLESHKYLKS